MKLLLHVHIVCIQRTKQIGLQLLKTTKCVVLKRSRLPSVTQHVRNVCFVTGVERAQGKSESQLTERLGSKFHKRFLW